MPWWIVAIVGQVRMAVRVADRDVVARFIIGAVDRHDQLRREAVMVVRTVSTSRL